MSERPRRGIGLGPVALGGIVLLAVLVRFVNLADQSLWLDEAFTHQFATASFPDMVSDVADTDANPPLFYAATWLVANVVGSGDFWLRFVSACAGTALVVVVYAIGAHVFDRRAGLSAAWLAAVSPILVWYSQEARGYALTVCLAALALLLFVQALGAPRGRLIAAWVGVSVLAAATHYFALIPFAVEAVILLPVARRRVMTALAVAAPVVVALIVLGAHQRGAADADEVASGSLSERIAQVPKQFLVGYDGPAQVAVALAMAALIAVFAGLPLLRRGVLRGPAGALAAVALATVAVPVLAAIVGLDFLNTRNVLFALPAFLALIGGGFSRFRPPGLGTAAAVATGIAGLVTTLAVALDPIYQRPPWRDVAAALERGPRPAVVVVTPAHGIVPLQVYSPELRALTQPEEVIDLKSATVAAKADAGSAATLPPPEAEPQPPSPFAPAGRQGSDAFAIVDFHAAGPVALTPQAAGAVALTPEPPAVLLLPAD